LADPQNRSADLFIRSQHRFNASAWPFIVFKEYVFRSGGCVQRMSAIRSAQHQDAFRVSSDQFNALRSMNHLTLRPA
jgi:hypothetical protein